MDRLYFRMYKTRFLCLISVLFMLSALFSETAHALVQNQLMNLEVQAGLNNKTDIILEFSNPIFKPKTFSVDSPASIVFDFPSTQNKLSAKLSSQTFSSGNLTKMTVVETNAKTRLVIDLRKMAQFNTAISGNVLKITLEDNAMPQKAYKPTSLSQPSYQIKSLDFKRGERGEGRIIVGLSNDKAVVDFQETDNTIAVDFINAIVNPNLIKQYDVSDFGTPVKDFVLSKAGDKAVLSVNAIGDYEKIGYQLDNQFIIEVRSITSTEKATFNELTGKYTGNKISLNFQDIDVRAILQIIADFSGFNIIASDNVKGNVTLRLQNVPWDQALDIILKSEGLDKRQYGNVMLVGLAAEIAAREKVELDSQKQMEDLGSMKSELVQINYASADDLATLLKDKTNSLMTSRGTVSVDKRTNTLLIQDIPARLNDIKALLKKLDVAVRQVEISTQLVTADDTLESVLGVRFGGGANMGIGHRRLGVGGNVDRARAIADYRNGAGQSAVPPSNATLAQANVGQTPNTQGPTQNNSEGLFSDLGAFSGAYSTAVPGAPAKVGLALAKLPNGTLLDLELQALEYESRSKTLARPKLVTMDQNKASVEKGVEIPYLENTSSGAASIAYKTAALKLDVTPHITPDDKISLDLAISNDSQGADVPGAGPSINTNRLETKVLVDNGETVVLGGVLQVDDSKQIAKVPFFGDLPIVGGLFRNKYLKHNPRELVIFLTPRIINPLLD